jgi:hypothetical protein
MTRMSVNDPSSDTRRGKTLLQGSDVIKELCPSDVMMYVNSGTSIIKMVKVWTKQAYVIMNEYSPDHPELLGLEWDERLINVGKLIY